MMKHHQLILFYVCHFFNKNELKKDWIPAIRLE